MTKERTIAKLKDYCKGYMKFNGYRHDYHDIEDPVAWNAERLRNHRILDHVYMVENIIDYIDEYTPRCTWSTVSYGVEVIYDGLGPRLRSVTMYSDYHNGDIAVDVLYPTQEVTQ